MWWLWSGEILNRHKNLAPSLPTHYSYSDTNFLATKNLFSLNPFFALFFASSLLYFAITIGIVPLTSRTL